MTDKEIDDFLRKIAFRTYGPDEIVNEAMDCLRKLEPCLNKRDDVSKKYLTIDYLEKVLLPSLKEEIIKLLKEANPHLQNNEMVH